MKFTNKSLSLTLPPMLRHNPFWLLRLTVFLLIIPLLAACGLRTEEAQIAAVNRRIAPEGHLTKTHLYVHWPAAYTEPRPEWGDPGGKELVPAVTLKIPFEYLGQNTITFENSAKILLHDAGVKTSDPVAMDYQARIKTALRVKGHQIESIYLRFQSGAKPDSPVLIYKTDPPEVASKKLAYFQASYAVHIRRNQHFAVPLYERTTKTPDKLTDITSYFYERPPSISCVVESCFASFGVKGRHADTAGLGMSLESFHSLKKSKPIDQQESAGLPKWREKVDPTQKLINSFILPEDNPEVKSIFFTK